MTTSDDNRRSRYYGLAQIVILAAFAATYLLDSARPMFDSRIPAAAGLALSLAGLLVMASALLALRKVIQIEPAPRPDAHLVTSGVYRYLRHPIYTGILAVAVGLFLRRPTVRIAAATAVMMAFLFVKVRLEERLLAARYPEYADYRRRAWGLIPGVRR